MKTNSISKLISLIFLSLFLNLHVNGQIDNFNLSDFKVPDLKRQGLDFGINLNGYKSNHDRIDTLGRDYKESNLFNHVSAKYYIYINKVKYQGEHRISLDNKMDIRNTSSKNHSSTYSSSSESSLNNLSIFYNSINRIYFSNLYYFEISPNGSTSFYQRESESQYSENNLMRTSQYQNSNSTYNYIYLPISYGKGRIEHIEDARHALYILNALKNNNRLKREPTQEEILEFAKIISETKNERVLDARLKKIYELNKIDSILNKLDLIEKNDIIYFSKLNDMWDFGGIPARRSGYRLAIMSFHGIGLHLV